MEAGLHNLGDLIEKITEDFIKYKYILLNGELGSGKTTFVKKAVEILCKTDNAHSPTFSIINSYSGNNLNIIHADLYRINSMDELEMTGFFEVIRNADIVFIEWPVQVDFKDILDKYIEINIITLGRSRRYDFYYNNITGINGELQNG